MTRLVHALLMSAVGLVMLGGPRAATAQDAAAPAPVAPAQTAPVQAAPAQAAPAPAGADEGGRYSFHRIGEGFVRLDSQTGQVAQCGWGATGWSCKSAPDERVALESEIARLQRENAALKKSLLSRGIDLPGGATAEAAPTPPAPVPDSGNASPKMPNEADVDRAIAYMKNVWRKLVDMMLDLQRDIQRKS